MKSTHSWILASSLMATWSIAPCLGAEPDKVPAIVLPAPLKPYSEVDKVAGAAEAVIRLLGTAKFGEPIAESPLTKAPCNVPGIASFYRGMTLMQAGYFIFINKMERGFESADTPHFELGEGFTLVPRSFGALVKPGRELLVAVWNRDSFERLLSVMSAIRNSTAAVNADLAAYFKGQS